MSPNIQTFQTVLVAYRDAIVEATLNAVEHAQYPIVDWFGPVSRDIGLYTSLPNDTACKRIRDLRKRLASSPPTEPTPK